MNGRLVAASLLVLAAAGCGGGARTDAPAERRHWGGPRLVAKAAAEAAVAVDGRGHAVVAWTTPDRPAIVMALRHPLRAGSAALPARALSSPGEVSGVVAAAGPAGTLVAWRQQSGTRQMVCASRLPSGAIAWSEPQCWEGGGLPTDTLQVAMGDDGTAIAAWTEGGVLRANTLR